jgi:hypothetical protein
MTLGYQDPPLFLSPLNLYLLQQAACIQCLHDTVYHRACDPTAGSLLGF